jgi:hypothetical protein
MRRVNREANQIILWISIALNLVALIVLFLKGRYAVIILSLAAAFLSPVAIFGTYWHHIITVPLQWWPLIALFRLAKPSSRWADLFYNEPKMQLARERYPTANPVPRSFRQQSNPRTESDTPRRLQHFGRKASCRRVAQKVSRVIADTSWGGREPLMLSAEYKEAHRAKTGRSNKLRQSYSAYRELVLPTEAQRYWKIVPKDETANVVAFSASA